MYLLLPTTGKGLRKEEEDQEKNIEGPFQVILTTLPQVKREEGQRFMGYKETCSLCKGNGYITMVIKGKDEIKQCWLCESKGEKEYSQAEVDDFIYKMYYKKGEPRAL